MEDAEPPVQHDLPYDYRTPEGETEDWQATLGYLAALEKSLTPTVVAVPAASEPGYITQQIGFIRHQGQRRAVSTAPPYESFNLFWPDPEQLAGSVALYEHLFVGATLSTLDGNDYFDLWLDFGSLRVGFLDSNTHLDDAHPNPERQLEDLRTADDFSREFEARRENEFIIKLRGQLADLRERLVELGAERAGQMSEAEIMAEAVRVRWKRRQHLVHGESLSEADWVSGLADAIRSHPESDESQAG